MPVNNYPIFIATPKVGMVRISTANTLRDGTGTLGDVITGATFGTRVDRIHVRAQGTTTAGMVRLFISDGTNIRFWDEVSVTAITPSATVQAFEATIITPDAASPLLVLPNAYVLKAGTHNAETFDVIAHAGDY
jgi:hypothetical protein